MAAGNHETSGRCSTNVGGCTLTRSADGLQARMPPALTLLVGESTAPYLGVAEAWQGHRLGTPLTSTVPSHLPRDLANAHCTREPEKDFVGGGG